MKQDELIFRADFLFHELKLNSYDEHCKKKIKIYVRTKFRTTKLKKKTKSDIGTPISV